MNYELYRWHPLHGLSLNNLLGSFLLTFVLNLKEVSFLSFMLNFDHKNGPKNSKGMLFVFLNSFHLLNMRVRVPQVVVWGRWGEEFQYIVGKYPVALWGLISLSAARTSFPFGLLKLNVFGACLAVMFETLWCWYYKASVIQHTSVPPIWSAIEQK